MTTVTTPSCVRAQPRRRGKMWDGRSCANSGHYRALCACVDRTFCQSKFVAKKPRHDTSAGEHYLGHKKIHHTVRYTELSSDRFRDFRRD
jgi:hypothetical protein